MSLFRALHLSDIHIGDTYMESKNIAFRIISDIEGENLENINCVIVTGDIFEGRCGFDMNLVDEAVGFFNIIYNELKRSSNIEKTDFLFVPGNHDIIRVEQNSARWQKYNAFLKKFYGSIPKMYNRDDFSLIKTYDNSRIVFAGFNSCGLKEEPLFDEKIIKDINQIDENCFGEFGLTKELLLSFIDKQIKDKKYMDFGEIQSQQLLNVIRNLRQYDDYNIIAFFHHHFYLFPEVYTKYGDRSLIRNYTNVIQQLQQAGVKTVLHGHKHFDLERPLVTDAYYENTDRIINIIAGGSVGTNRVSRHTFNIIDIFGKEDAFKLVQRKFVYQGAQLEPVIVRQIPPEIKESNSSIKLFNILRFNDSELYDKYIEAIEKINIAADEYANIVKWLENTFLGFDDIHKIFENDPRCVFFLLYAMNYRVLKMKQILGDEQIGSSYFDILDELLKTSIKEVGFDYNQFISIFELSDLDKLKAKGDEIIGTIHDKKSKLYLSFSMVSIFITDIYLILRNYSNRFYNKYIKYKVNIALDHEEFHQNVPVQKIMIHSDADRRSAFIDLRCNSATSHKMAVLFVKEFELMISKFEDFFKIVGLKLYYINPKIEKNNMLSALDNYNFEAYIPTLIPLLTGDNIYSRKEVFARELIQNSIDAIAVRASKDSNFEQKILITLGEMQGRKFFRIKDYGTGMDRFKIERYFTSIGRSFYSGEEYRELELDYKPISNFGIGFLSAFMICREIEVKTRYYLDEQEGLKLHIPNYDGCFFIEKEPNIDIGTEITLYIDKQISNDITSDKIINYICSTMQDIQYDIVIKDEIKHQETIINSHNTRRKGDNKSILFVPILETGQIEDKIDLEKTIWSSSYIKKYPYGLTINIGGHRQSAGLVLNSGIKLEETTINDVWTMLLDRDTHRINRADKYFSFNFPSNLLNIDVSREKITDFTSNIAKTEFKTKLFEEIICQLKQYFELSKKRDINNKAINVYLPMMSLYQMCQHGDSVLTKLERSITNNKYCLFIHYKSDTIELCVNRACNKPVNAIEYNRDNYSKCIDSFNSFISRNKLKSEFDSVRFRGKNIRNLMSYISSPLLRDRWGETYFESRTFSYEFDKLISEFNEILHKETSSNGNIKYIFWFILSFVADSENKVFDTAIMNVILKSLLETYTVSDIELGKCCVDFGCDEIRYLLRNVIK